MAPPPPPRRAGNDQIRTLLVIGAIVAVIAIIGVVIAIVVGGGDGDDDAAGEVVAYRPVTVDGDPLPEFSQEVRASGSDPAVGMQVPVVSGSDYAGNPITIDPATDGPTMIVLLAHWCPHCNAEIPVLNDWRDSGDIPDGLDIVGISTGVAAEAPNYPPAEWLEDKDWQWPVLADDRPPDEDRAAPAMGAYGGTSYPTMILVDGDGVVHQRLSGEVPIEVLQPLADDLVATSGS
jgi:thiol-disulfide isomerase/thioredoxin